MFFLCKISIVGCLWITLTAKWIIPNMQWYRWTSSDEIIASRHWIHHSYLHSWSVKPKKNIQYLCDNRSKLGRKFPVFWTHVTSCVVIVIFCADRFVSRANRAVWCAPPCWFPSNENHWYRLEGKHENYQPEKENVSLLKEPEAPYFLQKFVCIHSFHVMLS